MAKHHPSSARLEGNGAVVLKVLGTFHGPRGTHGNCGVGRLLGMIEHEEDLHVVAHQAASFHLN